MTQARQLFFQSALVNDQWAERVLLTVAGRIIEKIEIGASVAKGAAEIHDGVAIPGMANVHSHAFQRAFAGLSEYRTAEHDSFWTWRNLMFQFIEQLTPDDVYNVARNLYATMLQAGYTTVGEFHYLHHQPDGTPYRDVTAMADSLILAAVDVGMNICMLPVFYQRGGFDGRPLESGQKRFGCNPHQFLSIVQGLHDKWNAHPRVSLGVALHSLRAVDAVDAIAVLKSTQELLADCPIHIHVAEQTREVDECLQATGKRPVEYLMDTFEVNEHWCLIHATHMTDEECRRVAQCGAVVGVCPTTEANLGDGIFMAEKFKEFGGQMAIGSDSHVSVDPRSELRLLEYGQRLTQRRRAILCTSEQSCGRWLYEQMVRGGARATGQGSGLIAVKQPCNLVVLDGDHPALVGGATDRILDLIVFDHQGPPVREVVSP